MEVMKSVAENTERWQAQSVSKLFISRLTSENPPSDWNAKVWSVSMNLDYIVADMS